MTQAQCEAQRLVCTWNQQYLQCSAICSVKHPDGAGCEADPQCGWNNAAQKCEKACDSLTSESYCIAQKSCQWDSARQSCAPACSSYTNDGSCVSSGLCQFAKTGS
jgi:hypothetical protein